MIFFSKQLFHQYSIPWSRLQNYFVFRQLFHEYSISWYRLQIFFFFQTVISPIQHSLIQIAKCFFFFSNSYFTNTAFLGPDCKMVLFFKQLFHQYGMSRLSYTILTYKLWNQKPMNIVWQTVYCIINA